MEYQQRPVAVCASPENQGKPGHISFRSPLGSPVAITPYSEIYGVHPRLFDFRSDGQMQPAGLDPPVAYSVANYQSPMEMFMPETLPVGQLPAAPVNLPSSSHLTSAAQQ